MRTVRKVLRFLRSVEYSRRIVEGYKKIRDQKYKSELDLVLIISSALSALFTVLFFVTDHRVFLAEVPLGSFRLASSPRIT